MKTFGVLALAVLIVQLAIYACFILGIASVATSSIKAATGNCGHDYKIESLPIAGDLFCPSK